MDKLNRTIFLVGFLFVLLFSNSSLYHNDLLLGKDERVASDRESNEEKKALNASYEEMYRVIVHLYHFYIFLRIIVVLQKCIVRFVVMSDLGLSQE